jgi:hypothetical protein
MDLKVNLTFHAWSTDKPHAYTYLQDSPQPKLGGNHHLPPYNILWDWPWGLHPNVIFLEIPKLRVLKFPKLGFLPL